MNRMNRSRVHSGKPRGARSAYNLFFRDSQCTGGGAKMIAEKWRTLDSTKRRLYAQLATQDKLRYGLELVQWKQSVQQQEQEQLQRPAMKFSDSPQDIRPTIQANDPLHHCGKPYVTDGEGSCGDTAQADRLAFSCFQDDTDRVDEPFPIVDAFPLDPENDPLVHPGRLSHLAQNLGPQGVSEFVKLIGKGLSAQ